MGEEFISIDNYFENMKKLGYTASQEVYENAKALLEKVNALILDIYDSKLLESRYDIYLSSGYRTEAHNAKIKGSKKSHHISGKAVDLVGNTIAKICEKNISLLIKHDLYLESSLDTPFHTHLQDNPPKSKRRVFRA